MESWESGGLHIWQWQAGTWMGQKIVDRSVIDPTIWRGDDAWWLFCTFVDHEPNKNLHLFFADRVEGPWTAHPKNPVKTDLASSRPAGPLFRTEGRLIRPSQDCTQTYGGAIVLNAITRLDRHDFSEQPVRRLAPMGDYPDGLHTLCPAGDVTIIDGKRWAFHPLDPLRYMLFGSMNHYRRLCKRSAVKFFRCGNSYQLSMTLTHKPNLEDRLT